MQQTTDLLGLCLDWNTGFLTAPDKLYDERLIVAQVFLDFFDWHPAVDQVEITAREGSQDRDSLPQGKRLL